jgi:glycosyltransferase involved in cell wall biosynthesis
MNLREFWSRSSRVDNSSGYTKMNKRDEEYIIVDPPCAELKGGNVNFSTPSRVSFCIPTLNNEDTLDKCLKSIVNQEYPDTEIVIVDGGSTDNTIEIAKKYTERIYFDNGPLGSARQTSIEHSTGEILALFDSDITVPHSKWLANAVRYFNYSDKISTVWPMSVSPPNGSWTNKLYFNLWKVTIEDRIKKKRGVFGGGNALFLRRCFEEIGGINRSLHWGEDFDWAQRLKEHGYQVVLIRDVLYHDTMKSLRQFLEKQFTGAKTFTTTGFRLMALSPREVVYEQVILGTKGMISGLVTEGDLSWLLLPLFIFIRVFAYGSSYVKQLRKKETNIVMS